MAPFPHRPYDQGVSVEALMEMVRRGRLDLRPLLTHSFSLEQVAIRP